MAKEKVKPGETLISRNKRASFDYELGEKYEAGLVLIGTEVKMLRAGPADLTDSWCSVHKGEAILNGVNIPTMQGAAFGHENKRPRKLLLHAQEIQNLADAIARDGHDKTFKQLGGSAFLANLIEAQEGYGIALHITVPAPVEATGEVRVRLVAILAAVRDYVNRVSAHAEPDVPGSEELAEALLMPLSVWETTQRAAAPDADVEDATPATPADKTP